MCWASPQVTLDSWRVELESGLEGTSVPQVLHLCHKELGVCCRELRVLRPQRPQLPREVPEVSHVHFYLQCQAAQEGCGPCGGHCVSLVPMVQPKEGGELGGAGGTLPAQ